MIRRIDKLNELENMNVAFWIYSKGTRSFRYISPAVNKIFANNIQEITDIKVFRQVVHPEDQSKVIRNLNGGYSGNVDELEYRIITANGKIRWLKNTAIAVKDNSIKDQTVIGCTYIKSKLQQNNRQDYFINALKILSSLPGSYLIVNRKGKILQGLFNTSEKMLRKGSGSMEGKTISSLLDSTLGDKIKSKLSELNGVAETFSFEQRVCLDGKSNWFETRILQISSNDILVYIRNITELWNKVSTTEKFYRIAEQSDEMIMMTDVTGVIEYVNPKLCIISGYKANELIGKRASVFKSGKHEEEFYPKLWRTILRGKTFKAEFRNLKKTGDIFIEEKIITPLFNNGKITNFISTGRDITQDKRDEQKAIKYKQLQDTIAEKEEKFRTLSLIKSSENERKKFANEIHEGISQMLSAAMINLESLAGRETASLAEKSKIETVNHMVSEIIRELRGISTDLSPAALYKFGIFAVVKQMVDKNNLIKDGQVVKFTSNLEALRFKNEVEINLFRIIEEGLKNVIKHSHAARIKLNLTFDSGRLNLIIKDNGEGINMNALEFKKINTFGILNIEARAKSLGAELSISSKKGKGFTIELFLNTKTINP